MTTADARHHEQPLPAFADLTAADARRRAGQAIQFAARVGEWALSDSLAVTLLHRHFDLSAGEHLVWHPSGCAVLGSLRTSALGEYLAVSWRRGHDGAMLPYEFAEASLLPAEMLAVAYSEAFPRQLRGLVDKLHATRMSSRFGVSILPAAVASRWDGPTEPAASPSLVERNYVDHSEIIAASSSTVDDAPVTAWGWRGGTFAPMLTCVKCH